MTCEQCGAEYDRAIKVIQDGKEHVFDCFQCAIASLAPECAQCDAKIIGKGTGSGGELYCCEHCATRAAASASGEARVQ